MWGVVIPSACLVYIPTCLGLTAAGTAELELCVAQPAVLGDGLMEPRTGHALEIWEFAQVPLQFM